MLSLQATYLGDRKPATGGTETVPHYSSTVAKVGREHRAQEVLAYGDALYINPPEQNR